MGWNMEFVLPVILQSCNAAMQAVKDLAANCKQQGFFLLVCCACIVNIVKILSSGFIIPCIFSNLSSQKLAVSRCEVVYFWMLTGLTISLLKYTTRPYFDPLFLPPLRPSAGAKTWVSRRQQCPPSLPQNMRSGLGGDFLVSMRETRKGGTTVSNLVNGGGIFLHLYLETH